MVRKRHVPTADTNVILDGNGNGALVPGAIPYTELGLGQREAFDPWGTPIRYMPGGFNVIAIAGTGGIYVSSADANAYTLTSFGPDGALGGGDDYTVTRTVPELIGTIAGAGLVVDP